MNAASGTVVMADIRAINVLKNQIVKNQNIIKKISDSRTRKE